MMDPLFDISGKVFVITGASSGLGKAVAKGLLARGAKVANLSLEISTDGIDPDHEHLLNIAIDLGKTADVQSVFDGIEDRLGGVDCLINNAGVFQQARWDDDQEAQMRALFDVNFMAPVRLSRVACARMGANENGGTIINMSSVLATTNMSGSGAYGATKAALEAVTRSMAVENAGKKIRVNAIAPGWFPTKMTQKEFERNLAGIIRTRTPMRRLGDPHEIIGAVVYLSSDASRFVTGTVLPVDGGFSLIN